MTSAATPEVSLAARPPRSPATLAAVLVAFVLPLLATPSGLVAGYWSPRQAAVTLLAMATIPLVVAELRTRTVAGALAVAFAGWAAVSTALGIEPEVALWGHFGIGTGLLYVLALTGCWALGRRAGPAGALLVERGLLATAVVSVVIAVFQSLFDLSGAGMGLFDGRADAMTGNPVFLGYLLAGALWLAASRLRSSLPMGLASAAVLAIGIQLTGSRAALLVISAVVALVRVPRRSRLLLVGVVVAGLMAGALLAQNADVTSGSDRTSDTGGFRARIETWRSARFSIADSPAVGAGPGSFFAASSPHRTVEFVRAEGVGRYFFDAHNLLVEYSVTTGVVGVLLFVGWVLAAVRSTDLRGPLTGFALVVLTLHLAGPQTLAVTPLAFLALGAASTTLRAPSRIPVPVILVSSGVGVAAAVVLLAGFWALDQARLDFVEHHAATADRLLPDSWWQPREQRARISVLESRDRNDPELIREALSHRQRAAEAMPRDPRTLLSLADTYLQLGRPDAAEPVLEQVLVVDPWSVPALNALARRRAEAGNTASAVSLLRRSLAASPEQRGARDLLTDLDRREAGAAGAAPASS